MTPEQQNDPSSDWMSFIGKWGQKTAGHPLVYHLIDSAAVAAVLWEQALTAGAREQFSGWLQLPPEECGRLLIYWTSLHDLGKAAPSFQIKHPPTVDALKTLGFDFPTLTQAEIRHHSLLSQWALEDFASEINIRPIGAFNRFRYAIGGHHGSFHFQEDQVFSLARIKNLGNARWQASRRRLFTALTRFFAPPAPPPLNFSQTASNAFFNLLTGFFVAADWISSQEDPFQYHPQKIALAAYWQRSLELARSSVARSGWLGWQPDDGRPGFTDLFGFQPYTLQQNILAAAESLQDPFLMIVEAPTGCGKTEAALTVADRAIRSSRLRGCYVAMPTQATSDQMFERTRSFLQKRFPTQRINFQLVHGNALINEDFQRTRLAAVEDKEGSEEGSVNAMEWFLPRKRSLLAPFGVGTVDQTFLSVLRTRHAFLRLFGLHRKVIIFDEVHAYDMYMKEIFCRLLAWLRAVGSSVILLSATLPEGTRLELLEAFQPSARLDAPRAEYPRLSVNDGRAIHTLTLGEYKSRTVYLEKVLYAPQDWIGRLREKLAQGGCAAVICNTVDRAQEVYCRLKDARLVPDEDLFLLHARMPFGWRKSKEDAILHRFGKLKSLAAEPRRGIVVATQVIEQSLDLDFDLLVSDLAPIDLLIQRIGRLQRHTHSTYAPQRPATLRELLCLVCQPESPNENSLPVFENDRWVYHEAALQRTFFVLAPYDSIALPADSDHLINLVYSNEPLPACTTEQNNKIQSLHQKMLKKHDDAISKARNRLVGNVDESNALGGRSAYLKEDDPSVGRETQALTRDSIRPSVQLICFEKRDGQTYLLDGQHPFSPGSAPHGKALIHALRSQVAVSTWAAVDYFSRQPFNAAWRESPALRRAFPVVFEEGLYPLDNGHALLLQEQIGLRIIDLKSE